MVVVIMCVFFFYRESLYEDEGFDQRQRQLAALVVSKVLLLSDYRTSISRECKFCQLECFLFIPWQLYCFP